MILYVSILVSVILSKIKMNYSLTPRSMSRIIIIWKVVRRTFQNFSLEKIVEYLHSPYFARLEEEFIGYDILN